MKALGDGLQPYKQTGNIMPLIRKYSYEIILLLILRALIIISEYYESS